MTEQTDKPSSTAKEKKATPPAPTFASQAAAKSALEDCNRHVANRVAHENCGKRNEAARTQAMRRCKSQHGDSTRAYFDCMKPYSY